MTEAPEAVGAVGYRDQLASTLLAAEGTDRPRIVLAEWRRGRLTVSYLRDIICDVWCAAERPVQVLRLSDWLDLFGATGFVAESGAPAPTEPMILWRGAHREHRCGFSWTTDYKEAQWFARKPTPNGDFGQVWEAIVPPDAILAFVDGPTRDEHEVIVNPQRLEGTAAPTAVWPTADGIERRPAPAE